MRMLAQDRAFYRKPRVDGTDDPEALRRLRVVEGVDRMRERFTATAAARAFGVSRATYCEWRRRLREGGVKALVSRGSRPRTHRGRRWTGADVRRVLKLLLAERWPDHALGEAKVGRILQWAVARGRARPCSFCEGRVAAKRRRDFTGAHARRWQPRDRHVGVQFDHMTLRIDGKTFK